MVVVPVECYLSSFLFFFFSNSLRFGFVVFFVLFGFNFIFGFMVFLVLFDFPSFGLWL